jgi:hypothetical protein
LLSAFYKFTVHEFTNNIFLKGVTIIFRSDNSNKKALKKNFLRALIGEVVQ